MPIDQRQRAALRLQRGLVRARQRVAALPAGALAAAEELDAARRLLAAGLGDVATCASCVIAAAGRRRVSGRHGPRPAPPPSPWTGGRCCEAQTHQLFDEVELLLLAAADVRLDALRPVSPLTPENGEAGCAFRRLGGCALPAPLRPTVCVGYICRELARELERRRLLGRIARQVATMEDLRERFVALIGGEPGLPRPISGLAALAGD